MGRKNKRAIAAGIFAISCLVLGFTIFNSLSSSPAVDNSKSAAAEAHSAEIRKSIEAEPASQTPPPEIDRPKTKGAQRIGG